ncbi:hypothetical protein [Luteolibacter sp. Populi]|uniref:hypothetical protein n=1 Tax=Luteolibacter sp. Populi TaxID=3230487 RepID=UPI003467DEB2
MKLLLCLFLAATLAQASAFDEAAFGVHLNGWHRDGSARYSLNGSNYRTLKPIKTTDTNGNTVLRVTVLHAANSWAEVPFDLEVTTAPDGTLQGTRISGSPRGQKLDTGLISPPSPPEAAAPSKDPASAATEKARPSDPISEMKSALFASFDSKIATAAETKDTRKRDLLARIAGPEPIDATAISAGLRYNLDLLLGGSAMPSK